MDGRLDVQGECSLRGGFAGDEVPVRVKGGVGCGLGVFEDCGLHVGGEGCGSGSGGSVFESEGQLMGAGFQAVPGDLHMPDLMLVPGGDCFSDFLVCNLDGGYYLKMLWVGGGVNGIPGIDHTQVVIIFSERRVEGEVVLVQGEVFEGACESCDFFCFVCTVVGALALAIVELFDVDEDLVDCVLSVGVDVVSAAGHGGVSFRVGVCPLAVVAKGLPKGVWVRIQWSSYEFPCRP